MPRLQKTAGGEGDASWAGRQVSAGRLLCDTYISARVRLKKHTRALILLTFFVCIRNFYAAKRTTS